jgi:hypothetical protein
VRDIQTERQLIEEVRHHKQETKVNSKEKHRLKLLVSTMERDLRRKDTIIRQLIDSANLAAQELLTVEGGPPIEIGGVSFAPHAKSPSERATLRAKIRSLEATLLGKEEELANAQRTLKYKRVRHLEQELEEETVRGLKL